MQHVVFPPSSILWTVFKETALKFGFADSLSSENKDQNSKPNLSQLSVHASKTEPFSVFFDQRRQTPIKLVSLMVFSMKCCFWIICIFCWFLWSILWYQNILSLFMSKVLYQISELKIIIQLFCYDKVEWHF